MAAKKTSPKKATKKATSADLRPPIVTLLGHVDHGKTSLLDYIRKTDLQSKEARGITQSIGAYQIELREWVEQKDFPQAQITFIDTPGHEAFTSLRARGGKIADIVILVVAKNEGIKPQTMEAIDHAKAAKVPLLVAVTKTDLPGLSLNEIKGDLAKQGVLTEGYGGEVVAVETSVKTGQGIRTLLEMILLMGQLQNLSANRDDPATGFVLEAHKDERQGVIASVINQVGVLRVSDFIIIGDVYGRIRRLSDWQGLSLREVNPSMPAELLGLRGVPLAGERFVKVKEEKEARRLAEEKKQAEVQAMSRPAQINIADLFLEKDKVAELNLIVKADTQGSLEAAHHGLEKLSSADLSILFIHQGLGNINEADVMLAAASKAIILGFRVSVELSARKAAQLERVICRCYDVIYQLLEEVGQVIEGKVVKEEVKLLGEALVKEIFTLSDQKHIAGCKVLTGVIKKGHPVRLIREKEEIGRSQVSSLQKYKEKVGEVKEGQECGIGLKPPLDFAVGDLLQTYQS